jgi:hypothetical protein
MDASGPRSTEQLLRDRVTGGFTREALAALDKLYPERSPGKAETLDELRWRGGQRSVVRFLYSLLE